MLTFLSELRQYRLCLGYSPVPALRKAFLVGIPAKQRCTDEAEFLFLGSSDVGDLNWVIELWRYPDAAACMRHREASRSVPEWQTAIGSVAPLTLSFSSTLLSPTPASPLQ